MSHLAEDASELELDALSVLAGIVESPEGRAALIRRGADRAIATRLMAMTEASSDKTAMTGIAVLVRLVDDTVGSGVRIGSDRVVSVLDAIAATFAQREDAAKFAACHALASVLDLIRGSFEPNSATVAAITNLGQWQAFAAKGLRDILGSKLGEKERDEALKLAAVTTEFSDGILWAVEADKLLPLLIRTSSVELRMAIEDRAVHQSVVAAPQVAACCILCERAIKLFAEDGPAVQSLSLDPEVLVGIHTSLAEAGAAALALVEASDDVMPSRDSQVRLLLLSCVRLLGAWAAEDSEANRDRFYESLPMLLRLLQQLDADIHIDSSASDTALRWLLPGFCHVTADDTGRDQFVAAGGHALVTRVLLNKWISPALHQSSEEIRLSCITACSTLLNIVILAPSVVVSQPEFCELRNRVGEFLSNTSFECDLLLRAHLLTLFLRILIHRPFHQKEMQPAWEDLCAGLAPLLATMRPGSKTDDADDIAALWNLGEQALTVAAIAHPELARVLPK